jgi:hypothetical protein
MKLPKLPNKPKLLEKASYVALVSTIVRTLSDELHLDRALTICVNVISNIPADTWKILLWLAIAFYLGVATHGWRVRRSEGAHPVQKDAKTVSASREKNKKRSASKR